MNLGIFSLSLSVADLAASRAFYEKLGFAVIGGDPSHNYLMMASGHTKIGLFQGMFEHNTLTFNPTDVRGIQKHLKVQGIELLAEADEDTTGPAHMTLLDPDNNPILFDQHDDDFMAALHAGEIGWVDLTVPNAERVRDFYAEVVGWAPQPVPVDDHEDYNMTHMGQPVTGVCHQKGVNAGLPAQWMVYFKVADLAAALEKVAAQGGTVLRQPTPETGGYAVIQDPAGAICALMSAV